MVGAEAAIVLIGLVVVPIINELIRVARYYAGKKLLSPKELRELDESLVEISKLLVDTERMLTRGDPTVDMMSLQLIGVAQAAKSILDNPRTTGKAMESTVRLFAQEMRSILRKEKVEPTDPTLLELQGSVKYTTSESARVNSLRMTAQETLQLEGSLQTSTRHATMELPSSYRSSHATTGSPSSWPTSTPHATTESPSSSWSSHATTGSPYWPTSTCHGPTEWTSSSWGSHAATGSPSRPTSTRQATTESPSSSWSNHATTELPSSYRSSHATTGSPSWPTSTPHATTESPSSSRSSHAPRRATAQRSGHPLPGVATPQRDRHTGRPRLTTAQRDRHTGRRRLATAHQDRHPC